jgi:hypothetical protein
VPCDPINDIAQPCWFFATIISNAVHVPYHTTTTQSFCLTDMSDAMSVFAYRSHPCTRKTLRMSLAHQDVQIKEYTCLWLERRFQMLKGKGPKYLEEPLPKSVARAGFVFLRE